MNTEQFKLHYLDEIADQLGIIGVEGADLAAELGRRGYRPLVDAIEEHARKAFAGDAAAFEPLDLEKANRGMRYIKIVRAPDAADADGAVHHPRFQADVGTVAETSERTLKAAAPPSGACLPLRGKVLPGAAVLAGIGLIGHGVYKAATATTCDAQTPPRRNWRATLAHLGEVGIGVGLTWAALAKGFPAGTRQR